MDALRRNWYLGEDGFKDKLLGLMKKAAGKLRKKGSLAGDAIRAHNQVEAERISGELGHELGLPESPRELMLPKKGDPRKVACAALMKAHTTVDNAWIAKCLVMGHRASMSQLVHRVRRDPKELAQLLAEEEARKQRRGAPEKIQLNTLK